jgi:ATP adenylyltransferase
VKCQFCNIPEDGITASQGIVIARRDKYPVTAGHHLIITRRHVADYFDLVPDELLAIQLLLFRVRDMITAYDSSVVGFNIGVNCGESAGQTVPHVHVHLIPRRTGDCADPRGGVRGVIPGKQQY